MSSSYFSKVIVGALLAAVLSSEVHAAAGAETIPKDVARGDSPASRTTSSSLPVTGWEFSVLADCTAGVNLRTPGLNPISPRSYLTVNQVITSPSNRTLSFSFPASLFFGNPDAPVTFGGGPTGSTHIFNPVERRLTAVINEQIAQAVAQANGRVNINYTPVTLGSTTVVQSGAPNNAPNSNGEMSNGASYHPYNGAVEAWPEVSQTGNTSARLRLTFPVELNVTMTSATRSCTGWRSPLYLFFDEKRPHFTGMSYFPLDVMGRPVRWVEPNAPGFLLVLDRDGDGKIAKADEVFGDNGDATNGFEALLEFDANRDKVIDRKDPVFRKLQLWSDKNGDGINQKGELFSLMEKEVLSIDLKYDDKTITARPSGVEFRQRSTFTFTDKKTGNIRKGEVIDVWLGLVDTRVAAKNLPPVIVYDIGLTPTANLWPEPKFSPRSWLKGGL